MNILSRLLQNGFQCIHRQKFSQEPELLKGFMIEIGIITSFVTGLDVNEAQRIVTRYGEYLRHALEENLGYAAMDDVFKAAGLGPASHLKPDPCEARIMVSDPQDYGRQLTPRERLVDRAQRLDNVTKAVEKFGYEGCRHHRNRVIMYLYDRRPKAIDCGAYEE